MSASNKAMRRGRDIRFFYSILGTAAKLKFFENCVAFFNRGGKNFIAWPLLRFPHDQVENMMHGFFSVVVGAASSHSELLYVWDKATIEAKVIIVGLIIFSIIAWTVMIYKSMQMNRAGKLNYYFEQEFRAQK